MSSFSFLSDAFPNYAVTKDGKELFEDFSAPKAIHTPKSASFEDNDLLMKDLDHHNNKRSTPTASVKTVPEAFDASSDYFKILASKWEPQKVDTTAAVVQQSNQTGCMDVAEHIDKCSDCRARLEQIFRRLLERPIALPVAAAPVVTPTLAVVEKPALPVYVEITLLILLGIFIVFVLDAFVRLGKYFKAR